MSTVRLGDHELLIRLASGGAANVFLVRDQKAVAPGRLLALKILLPSLAQNDDFLKMFFAEAKLAAALKHPNVVAIAGFGQVEGIHCLAMEYVFGASLSQVLRASARAKKPLTVGVLLRITACVCDALHYAHELADENGQPMGVVHRDVTPQNILIGFNGVPKLTDFGIAKATNRGWETQAGIVKGKFSYMSPEQALGKRVDRRSDIFGTGIVLWEALTGRDLFRGSTPMEVLTAIREQKIVPPSKVVPGLTPIVDPIVMKALKRSPRGRYQTAAQMRDHIEELIQHAQVDITADTISHEFAAIYGDEIVNRAFALRQAMAGRAESDNLAKVLGGSLLNPKHLPVMRGGVNDPDPLGLFTEVTPSNGEAEDVALPARAERDFSSSISITPSEFEIVEADEVDSEILALEPEPEVIHAPTEDQEVISGWDDRTSMEVPDDELLSMLSEEDATIGYLPPAFADRFGAELQKALEENPHFDDEATVGITEGQLAELRALQVEDTPAPWDDRSRPLQPVNGGYQQENARSLRSIPRAPSLDMDGNPSARPVPRAPSLDMDFSATPAPKVEAAPHEAAPVPRPPPPPPISIDSVSSLEATVGQDQGPEDLFDSDDVEGEMPGDSVPVLPTEGGSDDLDVLARPASDIGTVDNPLSPSSLRKLASEDIVSPSPPPVPLDGLAQRSASASDRPPVAPMSDEFSSLPPGSNSAYRPIPAPSGIQVSKTMLFLAGLFILLLGAGIGLLFATFQ